MQVALNFSVLAVQQFHSLMLVLLNGQKKNNKDLRRKNFSLRFLLLQGEGFDEGSGGAEDDGVAAGVVEARHAVKLLDEGAGEREREGRFQIYISDFKLIIY